MEEEYYLVVTLENREQSNTKRPNSSKTQSHLNNKKQDIRMNTLKNTYEILNYWVFGPFPSSSILKSTTFWKLDLVPSSNEGMGDCYCVGSVTKS
jgi:hypothetical protein